MRQQICFLFSLGFFVSLTQAAVLSFWPEKLESSEGLSKDIRYAKWQNPTRILYRFDDNTYSIKEKALIMTAMSQIAADMNKCISFQEYNADTDAGLDNIYISKTLNDGSIPATCFTFYGRLLRAAGQGQKMAIHDGPNGCMDSQREIMKILVNVLGLRNEYNRPDRDEFIKVFPLNLQSELRFSNLLSTYNASQVDVFKLPFDYHSITIPRPNKYAIENEHIFEFPAQMEIPSLSHLSRDDCIGLSQMYDCEASKCVDHYEIVAPVADELKILSELHHDQEVTTEPATTVLVTEAATSAQSTLATEAISSTTVEVEIATSEAPITSSEAAIAITEAPVAIKVFSAAVVASNEALVQAQPANLTENSATTTLAPSLNVTLSDVIFPRKALTEQEQIDRITTEVPMVVVAGTSAATTLAAITEHHEDSTTAAVHVEETTKSSPEMKLILIMGSHNSSEVFAESTTAAAQVLVASTVAQTTVATSAASVDTTKASEVLVSSPVASTEAAVVASTDALSSTPAPLPTLAVALADIVPAVALAEEKRNETSIVMVIALDSTTAAAVSTILPVEVTTQKIVDVAAHNSTDMLAQ